MSEKLTSYKYYQEIDMTKLAESAMNDLKSLSYYPTITIDKINNNIMNANLDKLNNTFCTEKEMKERSYFIFSLYDKINRVPFKSLASNETKKYNIHFITTNLKKVNEHGNESYFSNLDNVSHIVSPVKYKNYQQEKKYNHKNYERHSVYENKNENKYENKNENKYENKNENKNENKSENRCENKNQNRNGNKYESKFENGNENKHENKNKYENRTGRKENTKSRV